MVHEAKENSINNAAVKVRKKNPIIWQSLPGLIPDGSCCDVFLHAFVDNDETNMKFNKLFIFCV